jgi:predicted aspartyl protease
MAAANFELLIRAIAMSIPYDSNYAPPAPILKFRLAAPGDTPQGDPLTGIVDTGSDGTLIPSRYLEAVEAINIGDGMFYGVLGEARNVHLYEADISIENPVLPGIVVVGDDFGDEIVIGRNILNRLILLLDGHRSVTDSLEQRPSLGKSE